MRSLSPFPLAATYYRVCQEFKDRKTYDIANSHLNKEERVQLTAEEPVCEVEVAKDAKAILFSRVTCPNCKVAENLLNKAGVAYEKLIADDNKDLCLQYGVKGAPTLVITDGENHVNYYSVPEIR